MFDKNLGIGSHLGHLSTGAVYVAPGGRPMDYGGHHQALLGRISSPGDALQAHIREDCRCLAAWLYGRDSLQGGRVPGDKLEYSRASTGRYIYNSDTKAGIQELPETKTT